MLLKINKYIKIIYLLSFLIFFTMKFKNYIRINILLLNFNIFYLSCIYARKTIN